METEYDLRSDHVSDDDDDVDIGGIVDIYVTVDIDGTG
jgi:hypothetical protein